MRVVDPLQPSCESPRSKCEWVVELPAEGSPRRRRLMSGIEDH